MSSGMKNKEPEGADGSKIQDYVTSTSFFHLNQSLDGLTPSQLSDALNAIRSHLLEGWHYVEKVAFSKQHTLIELHSKKQDFVRNLARRTLLDEERAFHFLLQYLSTVVADGSETPEFDDTLMSEVVSFYFRERIEVINIIASLFRRAEFLDADPFEDKNQEIYLTNVRWLLENGLESKCILLLQEAMDLDVAIGKYKKQSSENDRNRIPSLGHYLGTDENVTALKKQKLKEITAVLELLYVMYYSGHTCSKSSFDTLFKNFLVTTGFGTSFFQWTTFQQSVENVQRIRCLCLFITLNILGVNSVREDPSIGVVPESEIAGCLTLMQDVFQTNDSFSAVAKLIWACYMRFKTSSTYYNSPTIKDEINLLFSEAILSRNNALRFLKSLFDIQDPNYCFQSGSDNIFAYQSDVESVIWCALKVLPIENLDFLIEDILECLKFALHKNRDLEIRFFVDFVKSERKVSEHLQKHSGVGNQTRVPVDDPYVRLFLLIERLFPYKSYVVNFLSLLIFDNRSAEYATELVKKLKYHCFVVNFGQEANIAADSQFSSLQLSDLVSGSTYFDSSLKISIPTDTRVLLLSSSSPSGKAIVASRWNRSGWLLLVSYLQAFLSDFISGADVTSLDNSIHLRDILSLLYKVLKYGHPRLIHAIDGEFPSDSVGNTSYRMIVNVTGKSILSTLVALTRAISARKHESQSLILALCLRCFRQFSLSEPEIMVCILKDLCFSVYNSAIHLECTSGVYSSVVALLKVVSLLSESHSTSQGNLLDLVGFTSSNIFSIHETWRYRELSQKWKISRESLKIFNNICGDGFWRSSEKDLTSELIASLYSNASLYNNLFTILGSGHSIYKQLLEEEMIDNALIVQRMIMEALRLLKSLLQIRNAHYVTSGGHISVTPFEQSLLTMLVGAKDEPLIAKLFDYIDAIHPTNVNILAFKCINYIAKLTQYYHPRSPSLIGYLNRTSSEANTVVNKCMVRLRKESTDPELIRVIYDLLATAVEHQRGLSDKLLLGIGSCEEMNDSEEKEVNVLQAGCIRNIFHELRSFVKLKQSGKNTLVHSKVLLSCTRIIQSVLVGGHYEQVVKALEKDYSILWKLLLRIVELAISKSPSSDHNEPTRELMEEDHFLLQAVAIIISMASVELYSLNKNGRDQNMSELEKLSPLTEESFYTLIMVLLRKAIRFILSVVNDQIIFNDLTKECALYCSESNPNFKLETYSIKNRVEGDLVFDTFRMERCEKESCAKVISICKILNHRFQVCESVIPLLRSIRTLVSVVNTPAVEFANESVASMIFDIAIYSLRIGTWPNSSFSKESYEQVPMENICTFYPVHSILSKTSITTHLILSEILISVGRTIRTLQAASTSSEEGFGIAEDKWSILTFALDSQSHAGNWDVVKNILTFILYYLTTLSSGERTKLWSIFHTVSPALFKIASFNPQYTSCCELALCILQVFSPQVYSEQNIQFFCHQLSSGLTHFSSPDVQNYIYSLLLILQGIASSKRGCKILLDNYVIEKLANATNIHLGNLYENGKRSTWHMVWCQEIQLLTHMFNSSQKSNNNNQEVYNQLSSLSREILDKICDFCISHRASISKVLTSTLLQPNICMASLIEMESVTMLLFALARSGVLFWNRTLIENAITCLTQCHYHIDRFKLFLTSVQPVSDEEVNLHTQESSGKAFNRKDSVLSKGGQGDRQHLTWSTIIFLCVFGSLRNILSSLRCLSETPTIESIEKKESIQATLSEDMLRTHLIPLLRSCTDSLLRVYQNSTLASTSDPNKPMGYNERCTRKATSIAISSMDEILILLLYNLHSLNYSFFSPSPSSKKTPLEKDFIQALESVKKELLIIEEMSTTPIPKFGELKETIEQLLSRLNSS